MEIEETVYCVDASVAALVSFKRVKPDKIKQTSGTIENNPTEASRIRHQREAECDSVEYNPTLSGVSPTPVSAIGNALVC